MCCVPVRARYLVPHRIRRSPRRSMLPASPHPQHSLSCVSTNLTSQPHLPARLHASPHPQHLSHRLLALPSYTHAHVAFANLIATATACMVNCLCVAHAHVFVGCSNLSPHPVWVSPAPRLVAHVVEEPVVARRPAVPPSELSITSLYKIIFILLITVFRHHSCSCDRTASNTTYTTSLHDT